MKRRFVFWSVLAAGLFFLTVSFAGTAEPSHKLVKVGGMANHCDCTYRVE